MQLQLSNVTSPNRYPELFSEVSNFLEHRGRVLSFGCSEGDEVFTLASGYFDNSTIVGVDISASVIDTAKARLVDPRYRDQYRQEDLRNNYISFCTSDEGYGAEPFDVIFAMSVLCRWPPAKDLSSEFPFSHFNDAVASLDRALRRGGYLVLYNTTYRFADADVASRYRPCNLTDIGKPPFVHMFTPDGARIWTPQTEVVFQKLM